MQQTLAELDAGMHESLSDVVNKSLNKLCKQPEPPLDEIDDTILKWNHVTLNWPINEDDSVMLLWVTYSKLCSSNTEINDWLLLFHRAGLYWCFCFFLNICVFLFSLWICVYTCHQHIHIGMCPFKESCFVRSLKLIILRIMFLNLEICLFPVL